MTLEELLAKIKTLGAEMVSSIDLWAIDAELWILSGAKNLFSGNIMQLTLGQIAFTVFFALAWSLKLQEWYVGLRDFFFPDAESKDNP
jgi:hypothetical protein